MPPSGGGWGDGAQTPEHVLQECPTFTEPGTEDEPEAEAVVLTRGPGENCGLLTGDPASDLP